MLFNPDFKDMLSALSAAKVDFLLVSAYALPVHGHPRTTGDLDIGIRGDDKSASKMLRVLADFGAPLQDLTVEDLATLGVVFQIGVELSWIDILTSVSGVEFESAWSNRLLVNIDGIKVPVIGRTDLIANKWVSGRPKDISDAAILDLAGP